VLLISGGVCWLCSQSRVMDSDDEWNLDEDEEVVMPKELPKGSLIAFIIMIEIMIIKGRLYHA